jgi:hypothetical protein
MSEAPLRVDWLTFWIVFATAVFLVWSIAATLEMSSAKRRSKSPPEKGELTSPGPSAADEKHRPGGVIDVFNKNVEEGEGRLPILGWVVLIGVPIWWLSYLIIYWNKH